MKRNPTIAVLFAVLIAGSVASAEDDLTSLSYISYLERYATVQPAQQEQSIEAVINLPLVAGDRVDTAREARVEVVLPDGSLLWLDEYTTLSFDSVAMSRDTMAERTVLYLAEGQIMVELPRPLPGSQPLRVDSGAETVYLSDAGLYRLQTLRPGGLRVEVWSGLAEVSTATGGVLVRTNYAAEVAQGAVAGLDSVPQGSDAFTYWVEQRRQWAAGESSLYVDTSHARNAATLDNYGNWVYLESNNSWAWQPAVSSSWRPYSAGRWYWTTVGWSWVSYEPWGWLPYHYGSWYMHPGYGWVWTWDRYWSPAWVTWMWYPGYVGWCPAGYYDYYYWHHHGGGHHGGGHPGGGTPGVPPRRDVVPRRSTSTLAAPGHAQGPGADTLNLRGRTRLSAVDSAPWNVVATDDFASPHVARLVKPAEVAFRGHENAEAVVSSGALRTAAPGRSNPGDELRQSFAAIERGVTRDLTPVLARDSSLSAERARELARPTPRSEMSRVAVAGSTPASAPERVGSAVGARSMPQERTTRHTTPNIYRPVLESSPTAGRSSSPLGRRSLVVPDAGASNRSGGGSGVTDSEGRTTVIQPRAGSRSSSSPGTSSSSDSRPMVVPRSSSSISRTPSASDSGSSSSRSPRSTTRSSGTVSPRPIVIPRSSSPSTSSSSRSSSSSSIWRPSTSSSSRSSVGSSSRSSSSRSSVSSSSRSSSRSSASSPSRSSSSSSRSSRSSASSSRSSSSSSSSSSTSKRR